MREHVNLNKPEVKIVIQNIIWNNWGVKFPLSTIKISDKENLLYLNNNEIFRYDHHHHYTDVRDWPTAIHLYLTAIEELTHNTKAGMFIKNIPDAWRI